MSTKSRRFAERVSAFALLALAVAAGLAARASSGEAPGQREFAASYPHAPASTGSFAGVALERLVVPGLRLSTREDRTVDDGGVVLSYAEQDGHVRVVVTVAVARDVPGARRFVDQALHAVAATLPRAVDATLGDHAFADDEGRGEALVVAASANLAWVVHVDRSFPSAPRAADVARALASLAVGGVPTFPVVDVQLAPVVPLSGARVVVGAGARVPQLRAEGAYVAHGKGAPVLRPFGPGKVAVIGTVVDDLGRVGATRVEAEAR